MSGKEEINVNILSTCVEHIIDRSSFHLNYNLLTKMDSVDQIRVVVYSILVDSKHCIQ